MLAGLSNWLYEKFNGTPHDNWYSLIEDESSLFNLGDKFDDMLSYSFKHPILTGAMLFYCNLFAQAQFKIVDRSGKLHNGRYNDMIALLEAPNYYQTSIDFLESLQWMKIARGSAIIYIQKRIGFEDEPLAMYVLDPHRIKWPNQLQNTKIIQKRFIR